MSYLERVEAKAAMRTVGEPAKGLKGAFAPFEGDRRERVGGFSSDCAIGLRRLTSMSTPHGVDANVWARVIRDAQRLAHDGWAAKSLALGWSERALFGAITDPAGDPYADGLAVWLGGRKFLAITATTATVEDGEGRAYFIRREQVGARLIWELDQ